MKDNKENKSRVGKPKDSVKAEGQPATIYPKRNGRMYYYG